jgi:endonuclease/exonuclease/phosphatase family metal-dependent hydrolase
MLSYSVENIPLAVGKMGAMTHMAVLRKYLPEILECDCCNNFTGGGKTPFRAAVFNIERGAYLKQILAYFKYHSLLRETDIIFANEVDCGMARTGNLDIPLIIAQELGMNYAYAVEFLSPEAEKNSAGFHGNAIFSRFPLSRVKVVHLPIKYDWFYWQSDRRLGVRNAVLAEIQSETLGTVGLVSVHLENRTSPEGRREQMEYLLNEAEAHFGDIPVLLGGDLNTLCYDNQDGNGGDKIRHLAEHPAEQLRCISSVPSMEPLLNFAASRGFGYADCNILEKPTCRDAIPDGRTVLLNLDWFLARGLPCFGAGRVESIFRVKSLINAPNDVYSYYGQEMSDHDMVFIDCGT